MFNNSISFTYQQVSKSTGFSATVANSGFTSSASDSPSIKSANTRSTSVFSAILRSGFLFIFQQPRQQLVQQFASTSLCCYISLPLAPLTVVQCKNTFRPGKKSFQVITQSRNLTMLMLPLFTYCPKRSTAALYQLHVMK